MELTAILGIIILFLFSIKGTYEAKKIKINSNKAIYFYGKLSNFIFSSMLVNKTKEGYKKNYFYNQKMK